MLELDRKFTVRDLPLLKAELNDTEKRLKDIKALPEDIKILKTEEVEWLGERAKNLDRIIKGLRTQIKCPVYA